MTRSGHCFVLSDLTSLSVSLIWPGSTPLPVHVRVHVCKLAVSPWSNGEVKHSTFSCFPLRTLRRCRMRDVFDSKLRCNVIQFFTSSFLHLHVEALTKQPHFCDYIFMLWCDLHVFFLQNIIYFYYMLTFISSVFKSRRDCCFTSQ